ncbi:MAG: Bax inhibitor-1/YccA family protein [Chitinophagales bacterium]
MDTLDQNLQQPFSVEAIFAEQQRFIVKVYGWMCAALVLTGVTAYIVATTPSIMQYVFTNLTVLYVLLGVELLMVIGLSSMINKMSANMATAVFVLYSVVNGLTLSFIFLVYTSGSIAFTFFITAATFGVMSAYGYFTKKDLTSWGNLLVMALLGLVIASIGNLFMKSDTLMWITTYAGILIFVGLTAYDTQRIKNTNIIGNEGTDEDRKEAIIGALTLYLDFINLFLKLLRLFGRRR